MTVNLANESDLWRKHMLLAATDQLVESPAEEDGNGCDRNMPEIIINLPWTVCSALGPSLENSDGTGDSECKNAVENLFR